MWQAGTHFYHPHHHGSALMQAGGGATGGSFLCPVVAPITRKLITSKTIETCHLISGIIIVEDAPGDIPDQILEMEEVILMVNHIDIDLLSRVQVASDQETLLWNERTGNATEVVLTNGQVNLSLFIFFLCVDCMLISRY